MAESPRITRARAAERSARDARLAKALRENLRRRKEQSRARTPDGTQETPNRKPAEPPA